MDLQDPKVLPGNGEVWDPQGHQDLGAKASLDLLERQE